MTEEEIKALQEQLTALQSQVETLTTTNKDLTTQITKTNAELKAEQELHAKTKVQRDNLHKDLQNKEVINNKKTVSEIIKERW